MIKLSRIGNVLSRPITIASAIFAASCVLSVALAWYDATSVSKENAIWPSIFPLLSSLAVGGIVSYVFYIALVFYPERKKRKTIKWNLLSTYREVKRAIAMEVIHASELGGRSELSADTDTIQRCLTCAGFKDLFEGGKHGHEGFYAFQNQMSERTAQYAEIIFNLQRLNKEIDVTIHTYGLDDLEIYGFFRRMDAHLKRIEFLGPGYDTSRLLCQFVWDIFAGWNWKDGDLGYDRIERLIENI